MRKILPALVLTSLLAVSVIGIAQAANCLTDYLSRTTCENVTDNLECTWVPNPGAATPDTDGKCLGTSITTAGGLIELIETIGNWIFAALLGVAAIFLVVAGFMFVTAGGNPEQATKARQMLINALIGVAIALGAKGMITVITNLIA